MLTGKRNVGALVENVDCSLRDVGLLWRVYIIQFWVEFVYDIIEFTQSSDNEICIGTLKNFSIYYTGFLGLMYFAKPSNQTVAC